MKYDKFKRTTPWEGPFHKNSSRVRRRMRLGDVLLTTAIGITLAALAVAYL